MAGTVLMLSLQGTPPISLTVGAGHSAKWRAHAGVGPACHRGDKPRSVSGAQARLEGQRSDALPWESSVSVIQTATLHET